MQNIATTGNTNGKMENLLLLHRLIIYRRFVTYEIPFLSFDTVNEINLLIDINQHCQAFRRKIKRKLFVLNARLIIKQEKINSVLFRVILYILRAPDSLKMLILPSDV